MQHGLCAGTAERFEVRVQTNGRQSRDHQKLADGLQAGNQPGGQKAQTGQQGHGKERKDEPGENGTDAHLDTVGLGALFLFQVQVDGGKDQNSRNDRQRAGQLDHRCKVTGCFTESVTGGYDAGGIVDRRTGPETECGIGKPEPPAKEREHNDHHRIEQEGGGHTVGDVHVIGLDHRCNGGNGRAATDAGSGVDQAAGFPVEPERSADQRAQPKAGGQGEEHDRQRKTAHGQHGADVQAGTQKDDGEFQDFFRGEFDAGRGCFVGLEKRIDGHADKQGDDRCANEVEPSAAFQRFQPLGDAGDAQCQRGSGNQGGDLL